MSDRLRKMTDGEIFNTITNGKGQMMGYGYNIAIDDRWRIVMYIRALQRSQNATLADASAAEQGQLDKTKKPARLRLLPTTAPLPAAGGSPAAPDQSQSGGSPVSPKIPPSRMVRGPRADGHTVADQAARHRSECRNGENNKPAHTSSNRHPVVYLTQQTPEGLVRRLRPNLSNMSGHPHIVHLPPAERLGAGPFPLMLLFARHVADRPSSLDRRRDGATRAVRLLVVLRPSTISSPSRSAPSSGSRSITRATPTGRSSSRRIWENMLDALSRACSCSSCRCSVPDFRDVLWKWMGPGMSNDHELAIRAASISTRRSSTSASSVYFVYFILRRASITAANRSGRTPTAIPVWTRRMHDHSYLALVIFGLLRDFPELRLVHGPGLALGLEPLRRLQFRRLRAGRPGRLHRHRRAASAQAAT